MNLNICKLDNDNYIIKNDIISNINHVTTEIIDLDNGTALFKVYLFVDNGFVWILEFNSENKCDTNSYLQEVVMDLTSYSCATFNYKAAYELSLKKVRVSEL